MLQNLLKHAVGTQLRRTIWGKFYSWWSQSRGSGTGLGIPDSGPKDGIEDQYGMEFLREKFDD